MVVAAVSESLCHLDSPSGLLDPFLGPQDPGSGGSLGVSMTGELSPQHRDQASMSCGRGVPVAGRQGCLGRITPSAPGPSTGGLALLPQELSSAARSLPCVAGALKETRRMLLTVAFFPPYQLDLWPSPSMLTPAPVQPPHRTVHHCPPPSMASYGPAYGTPASAWFKPPINPAGSHQPTHPQPKPTHAPPTHQPMCVCVCPQAQEHIPDWPPTPSYSP